MRALYIRLRAAELTTLADMAAAQRRSPQEQAAFLVSAGLARWRAERDFEATLDRSEVEEEVA